MVLKHRRLLTLILSHSSSPDLVWPFLPSENRTSARLSHFIGFFFVIFSVAFLFENYSLNHVLGILGVYLVLCLERLHDMNLAQGLFGHFVICKNYSVGLAAFLDGVAVLVYSVLNGSTHVLEFFLLSILQFSSIHRLRVISGRRH